MALPKTPIPKTPPPKTAHPGTLPRAAHPGSRTAILLAALLTVAGLTVAVPAAAAPAAPARPAINEVPCDRDDYLHVWWHANSNSPRSSETCLANGGTFDDFVCIVHCWLDAFSTGNNRVQYLSDGRWQPDTPVGKNTYYTFPNHPGGVDLGAVRIV